MGKRKVSIITGITGQDGAYLGRLLIEKGHSVIGVIRSYTQTNFSGLEYLHILDKVKLVECDLTDLSGVVSLFHDHDPDEVYNLAAQSSVSLSFTQPIGTFHFNTISVFNLLEAIRMIKPSIRFYQASSSEMYGDVEILPITAESTPNPKSPYAVSKAASHWTCHIYRESYQMFVCTGILFNHESHLRSKNFFTKKVIRDVIRISEGKLDYLEVGNIDIKRDFGYAPKYVEAMYLMLQQKEPTDYFVCSGVSVSLRDIVYYLFDKFNVPHDKVKEVKEYFRPNEIPDIYGVQDPRLKNLGWNYDMTFFEVLDLLVSEELKELDAKN